jgi:hypothetical protein
MMSEAATATADTTAATTTAATTAPWYDGKADAETIGFLQNRGWDKDPITAAVEASKAYREAQRMLGGPPDQLLRLPKDVKDGAAWDPIWQRLGKPKEIAGYDFTDVKFADGTAINEAFADSIRKAAFENHIPKDAATAFARAMVKHAETNDQNDTMEAQSKLNASLERLKQNWGPNFARNELMAMEGARRLGVTQEQYDQMKSALGADVTAEMFRKIGQGTSEDSFIEGRNQQTLPNTVEAAKARKAELLVDKEWMARYRRHDTAAMREMRNLNQIITGVTDTAA